MKKMNTSWIKTMAAAAVAAFTFGFAPSAEAAAVSYREPVYVGGVVTNGIDHWATNKVSTYTPVTGDMATTWGAANATNWYVVANTVAIANRITCVGQVNLILKDGATLNAKAGITASPNTTGYLGFTVYAQSEGEGMGALVATESIPEYYAGIGGIGGDGDGGAGSNITINGGTVTATGAGGGSSEPIKAYAGGAGIGGGGAGNGGTGGAGSNITINGGTVTATGSDGERGGGAGIGGGSGDMSICGGGRNTGGSGSNITINGGMVTATGSTSDDTGHAVGGGAGIGGGRDANGSNITINGGTVMAKGYGTLGRVSGGAGIGGGGAQTDDSRTSATGGDGSYITINGGDVTATGCERAAGIGGAYGLHFEEITKVFDGRDGSYITINGGTVTATCGMDGAGIGGGASDDNGTARIGVGSNITINGGTVTAKSVSMGAGIGGGRNGNGSNITINGTAGDCTVTATGAGGAGIGGGFRDNNGSYGHGNGSNITINGGDVTATSTESGAGIGGGGDGGDGSNITINGGTVTATSCYAGAGIGGGNVGGNGSYITISGGTVTASSNVEGGSNGGAGIGGGRGGDGGGNGSNITISGGIVTATSHGNGRGVGGAGIGGGGVGDGSTITISGGTVTATGGFGGAGIGGGQGGDGSNITITDCTVTAMGGVDWGPGAGIGGGDSGNGTDIKISGATVFVGSVVSYANGGEYYISDFIGSGFFYEGYGKSSSGVTIDSSTKVFFNLTGIWNEADQEWIEPVAPMPESFEGFTIMTPATQTLERFLVSGNENWAATTTFNLTNAVTAATRTLEVNGESGGFASALLALKHGGSTLKLTAGSATLYDIAVTTTPEGSGAVKADPSDQESAGCTVTLTMTPKEGYALDKLSVAGATTTPEPTEVEKGKKYTFTMPAEAVTVSATFAAQSQSITLAEATSGTVTTSPEGGAKTDETVTITTTPDAGYELATLTVTKTGDPTKVVEVTPTEEGGTFTMPGYPVTVTVTFRNIFVEVAYRYPVYNTPGDPTGGIASWEVGTTNAILVQSVAAWGEAGNASWYAVTNAGVVLCEGAACQGDVNLVLCEGAWIEITNGVGVAESASLTVYGQPDGAGALWALGKDGAGIAGSHITLNGGTVAVSGGTGALIGGDGASGNWVSPEAKVVFDLVDAVAPWLLDASAIVTPDELTGERILMTGVGSWTGAQTFTLVKGETLALAKPLTFGDAAGTPFADAVLTLNVKNGALKLTASPLPEEPVVKDDKGNDMTIVVPEEWRVENKVLDEDAVDTKNPMINGMPAWQNYVLGLEPKNIYSGIYADSPQNTAADKVTIETKNLDVQKLAPGYSVKYRLDTKLRGKGEYTKGVNQDGATFEVSIDGDDPTGVYKLNAVIFSNGVEIAQSAEAVNIVGMLKQTQAITNAIIAVPWSRLAPGLQEDIKVTDVVKTATLDAGDELRVYRPGSSTYEGWTLNANKQWVPSTTVAIDADGKAAISEADDPTDATIPRGSGIWLCRKAANADKPYYLYGQAEGEASAELTKGSNLIGATGITDYDFNAHITGAAANDSIVVTIAGAIPKVYEFKDGAWGRWAAGEAKTVTDRYGNVTTTYSTIWKTDDAFVKPGTGFWLHNNSGKITIK